ncbi:cation diffusion facilitator family transporter [Sediminibacillus dalangtanensis]|uniref:Cation diffusion facilitator family transporter n=1 Tax=Sediminibacillus dalangtanensis TaxID=2729421 RepID=A0ABX7VZ30_9BACI|nr:cation diffusion facilitator family transporter [Sediminibacillus dalangtanensis]QTN00981.1 cation diffusion facilitator family transporter [Sediminibacillus dalangtanensis]
MKELWNLLKQGTKSSLWAATVNIVVGIIKTIAYFITGNVAMFAEMMHSYADAANQFFVFIGSALSKKAPTDRFPNGFGRLVNLVLLGAVLIVGILAYETIKEGIYHIIQPEGHEGWFWLNIGVLGVSFLLEGFVLTKAMKEITEHISDEEKKGLGLITQSFKHAKEANPATKLVFLEDLVATLGALIAMIAIALSSYTPFHSATGYASIVIGMLLFIVVGRIFLDNAAGALGITVPEMENAIGNLAMKESMVKDIKRLHVIKEGDQRHVELKIEIDPKVTIAAADDMRDRLEKKIKSQRGVTDVIIEFDEDDQVPSWSKSSEKEN